MRAGSMADPLHSRRTEFHRESGKPVFEMNPFDPGCNQTRVPASARDPSTPGKRAPEGAAFKI